MRIGWAGGDPPANAIGACHFTPGDRGLLFVTALFSDSFGLGYLPLGGVSEVRPVRTTGATHGRDGKLVGCRRLQGTRYALEYNVEGVTWLYEGDFDEDALDDPRCRHLWNGSPRGRCARVGELRARHPDVGVVPFDRHVTASVLYRLPGSRHDGCAPHRRTVGRAAGRVPFARGGRLVHVVRRRARPGPSISACPHPRLCRPASPRVLRARGPHGQERPDFAWFSTPLIQFLALHGLAVFVPSVRGSGGYGLAYAKRGSTTGGGGIAGTTSTR